MRTLWGGADDSTVIPWAPASGCCSCSGSAGRRNAGAVTGSHVEEVFGGEEGDGAMDGGDGVAVPVCEVFDRGQRVAGLECSGIDRGMNVVCDQFVRGSFARCLRRVPRG